jgi:hypothetical protein
MKQITFFILFNISVLSLNAQIDSVVFTYNEYLLNILKYHPIAKQAALKMDMADAEWLAAKGQFDWSWSASWKQKNFDDKLYYRIFQNKLQVPTPLGIDIVGGYDNASGDYLNPERKTGEFGLWYLGVEANLWQGLLVDERRTALQQAKIYQNIAENQKRIILNDLLYEASIAYLDWQQYHAVERTIMESIDLAKTYLENTKITFLNGEKTAIDTLEAFIILQDRIILLEKNRISLTKSKQKASNYLWFNDVPLELTSVAKPQAYLTTIFEIKEVSNLKTQVQNHPLIQEKVFKQDYYEVEQRWKEEKLKPKLKAKFNPLLATADNSIVPSYSTSDYTFGLDFSMPIPMRSERAAIQEGAIKIQDLTLDIQNKENEMYNKIIATIENQQQIENQLVLQRQGVQGYLQLLNAENEKFLFGESSVFLINKRQEKYMDGQLKLIELSIKLQQERLNYLYFTNKLLSVE